MEEPPGSSLLVTLGEGKSRPIKQGKQVYCIQGTDEKFKSRRLRSNVQRESRKMRKECTRKSKRGENFTEKQQIIYN